MLPFPQSQDARRIRFGGLGCGEARDEGLGAGDAEQRSFAGNAVFTSKYTILSFVPLNLWEQLHKAANVYFLGISIIMMLGNYTNLFVGTVKFLSTFLTLAIMMTMSAVIAALDDVRRHRSDSQTNAQAAVACFKDGEVNLRKLCWKDVAVGDVLVLLRDKELPADMVLLASSGDEGSCYVSTANLDGETNLKIKTAVQPVQKALCDASDADTPLVNQAVEGLRTIGGTVSAEAPKKSIHSFSGSLQLHPGTLGLSTISGGGVSKIPLGPEQLLLRGTVVRNTAWCLGLVVYTGTETRMVMNSQKAKPKYANLEKVINRSLFVVIGAQCFLALISDVLYCATKSRWQTTWYVHPDGQETHILLPDLIGYWLTFFVLYSNLMPISLYFTMEVCNVAQAYFIKNDEKMYDEEEDVPANSRATNLGHELGQVSYIFSDKTGTLTQNIMELKRVSIGGEIFGQVGGGHGFHGGDALATACQAKKEIAGASAAFLEVLAVSHTVVTTRDQHGNLKYEAESPDESALVAAAANLGWAFRDRSRSSLVVDVDFQPSGGEVKAHNYSLLALNAFTSARKRQSVIVRRADGQLVLLVKGADDAMLKRAAQTPPSIQDHLTEFAQEGLRTLVLGRRDIPQGEFESWAREYEEAQTALLGREEALANVAEKIEVQLEILGVTAIEDRLQVGVEETIVRLREAGVNFWVLTGDKLETARNIGFSTRVLTNEMDILVLDATSREEIERRLRELAAQAKKAQAKGTVAALLVTGQALEIVTASPHEDVEGFSEDDDSDYELERSGSALAPSFFHSLAERCSVVLACRVSPLQKAEMVRLVRDNAKSRPVTLAIGDGANDVPMIQEASIGVGISGREGRQAANSADFSISQFRFLQRLLLVHGRWNYRRTCKFVLYSFWKNTVLVLLMFYYTLASGFAGISLFEDMVRASYNVILATPIVATGIFDKDIEAEDAEEFPKFYEVSRRGLDLNPIKLVEMLLSAFFHSTIILSVMVLAYDGLVLADLGDYYSFGTTTFTVLIVSMNYRASILTFTWTAGNVLAHVISWVLYALFLGIYCMVEPVTEVFNPWMYMLPVKMLSSPLTYICLAVVPLLAIVIDVVKVYLMKIVYPSRMDILKKEFKDFKRGLEAPDQERDEAEPSGARSTPQVLEGDAMMQDSAPPALTRASSYDFAHPDGPPRDHRTLRPLHPTAGDTSLPDRTMSGGAASSSTARSNPVGFGLLPRGASESSQGEESDSEDSSDGTGGKPNRPDTSRFAQQALPSTQVEMGCKLVVVTAFVSGLLLVSLGCLLTLLTEIGGEIFIPYSGNTRHFWVLENFTSRTWNFSCPEKEGGNVCASQFTMPFDMPAPVEVHYSVYPFYQNYPDYIQSGLQVWPELTGKFLSDAQRKDYCPPTSRVTPEGKQIYPCGVAATSLFNDTLEICSVLKKDTGKSFVPEMYTHPAWPSDVERFGNPSIYPEAPGAGAASAAAEGFSWLFERYPGQRTLNRSLGARDPHFVAWMRPQALSWTVKRFSLIRTDLKKGDRLTVRITSNFPVGSIGAGKTFIITSGGALRDGDGNFGWFCIIGGGVCLTLAFLVVSIHSLCGDDPGQLSCHDADARAPEIHSSSCHQAESSEGSDENA